MSTEQAYETLIRLCDLDVGIGIKYNMKSTKHIRYLEVLAKEGTGDPFNPDTGRLPLNVLVPALRVWLKINNIDSDNILFSYQTYNGRFGDIVACPLSVGDY